MSIPKEQELRKLLHEMREDKAEKDSLKTGIKGTNNRDRAERDSARTGIIGKESRLEKDSLRTIDIRDIRVATSSCRIAYMTCIDQVHTERDKEQCAMLFNNCFNTLFYGRTTVRNSNCASKFDQCLTQTVSKVETFVCQCGRQQCSLNCMDAQPPKKDSESKRKHAIFKK